MRALQAIHTKYFGPSNKKGSRIIAKCDAKRMIVEYDDALNSEENHNAAARKLADSLSWKSPLVCGAMPNNGGVVHVALPDALAFVADVTGEAH